MKKETVPFEILRMDPFGQGVATHEEKMLFIPATLPGEKGLATIEESKGQKVLFGKVDSLEHSSDARVQPECQHFDQCQGCSFQHTSYEEELKHKKEAYSFLFKKYKTADEIDIIKAPERFAYRNRLQLHYDLKKGRLGFMNGDLIHEVPHCLLGKKAISDKLSELYKEQSWKKLIPRKAPPQGHIELYAKEDNEVNITINEPYSAGGFSQVYEEMGNLAQEKIADFFKRNELTHTLPTLDVFGGAGFLSQDIGKSRLVCDTVVPEKTTNKNSFVTVNLYDKYAMARLEKKMHKHLKDNKYPNEVKWNLIVDPPRSGFKTLGKLTNIGALKNKVNKIAYLSCHPQSFKRDLDILMQSGEWHLESLTFLDFFPATHHLESLAFLSPINN